MNIWLAAATVLLAATAPLGWLAFRRSPADGIVIERNVNPGELYEPTSVLMVIGKRKP